MIRSEPISAVMTRDVLSVQRSATPSQVRDLLRTHSFHHVPVLDGDVVVGMISAADLARIDLSAWGVDESTVDAELDASFDLDRLMSHDVVSVGPDERLIRAAELLADGSIHALPVVDDQRRLVGLITTTDLVRHLYYGG